MGGADFFFGGVLFGLTAHLLNLGVVLFEVANEAVLEELRGLEPEGMSAEKALELIRSYKQRLM